MIFSSGEGVDFHERIRLMFEEAKASCGRFRSDGPYIWGFTMSFGRDGRPLFEEFGNVSPFGVGGYIEPVTDVIERLDSVSIIVELPGVDKDEIDLRASVESVFIKVDKPLRKYVKDVKLSCRVRPESAVAKYNNGVLEVTLQRVQDDPAGSRVKIQ